MSHTLERQYLSFSLSGGRYALSVDRVREVLESSKITRLPCQAPYLKGIIDLRGKGVPVIDLRQRFGMERSESTRDSAIVVVEMRADEDTRIVGLLADAVHEVVELDPSGIDAPPRFGTEGASDFLRGIAKDGDGFVLVCDADRLLETDELLAIASAASTASA